MKGGEMKKRETLNVYFEINGRTYPLFNVTNIGNESAPDLKFAGFFDNYLVYNGNSQTGEDMGYFTEKEMEQTCMHSHIEFTYHNDGSFLQKDKDYKEKKNIYFNPYGKGARWTPINDITDVQPVISIAIRRMTIYRPRKPKEEDSKNHNYICKNDDFFNLDGTYLVVVFLKQANKPMSCFTTKDLYTDILCHLNKDLDICIFLQRHGYPTPQPYFTKHFGGIWIKPYQNNTITFCNKETSIDELTNRNPQLFEPVFSDYLRRLGEGNIVNLSEDKLKIIDIIDDMYSKISTVKIHKPEFTKHLLSSIHDYKSFNEQTIKERKNYVEACYQIASIYPILMQKHKTDFFKILESNMCNRDKLMNILNLINDVQNN